MYFIKRKQNIKHKYRPKLRRNIAYLSTTAQAGQQGLTKQQRTMTWLPNQED
jgi:hypothetical protein